MLSTAVCKAQGAVGLGRDANSAPSSAGTGWAPSTGIAAPQNCTAGEARARVLITVFA